MQSHSMFEWNPTQEKVFIASPARSGTARAAPVPLMSAFLSGIGRVTQ